METSNPRPAYLNKIEYDRVYQLTVGNIPIVFGHMAKNEKHSPDVYAAALSERELRHESCGYGATEAEAAADLFRWMR